MMTATMAPSNNWPRMSMVMTQPKETAQEDKLELVLFRLVVGRKEGEKYGSTKGDRLAVS